MVTINKHSEKSNVLTNTKCYRYLYVHSHSSCFSLKIKKFNLLLIISKTPQSHFETYLNLYVCLFHNVRDGIVQ